MLRNTEISTPADELESKIALPEPAEAGVTGPRDEGEGESGMGQLREELHAERDRFLRLAAEFDNYRRRTKLERENAAAEGKRALLTILLTFADDLDLALEGWAASAAPAPEGIHLIRRRFLNLLDSNGVVPFESVGERFDPEKHDAFDVVPASEGESGIVYKQLRRGYLFNGRLLRPALVIVTR